MKLSGIRIKQVFNLASVPKGETVIHLKDKKGKWQAIHIKPANPYFTRPYDKFEVVAE